jgi:hypothetical protein
MRELCLILACALALAAAPRSPAQQPVLPDRFGGSHGGWSAGSPAQGAKPDGVPQDQLKEAGLTSSWIRTYSNNGRNVTVALALFKDPSSAYQIYTAQISPNMLPSTVGSNTAVDHDKLIALVGNLIVRVLPPQDATTAELVELLKVVRSRSDQAALPPVRSYLPEGFSDGTQRYALGPVGFVAALDALHRSEYAKVTPEIGFANGAEVMLAEYHKRNDSAVLLLVAYPTPQLAEQHLRHLQTILPDAAAKVGVKIERKGSLLSLVLGATSEAYAESLRSAINYETQVTWNEPSHTLTDPPWLVIVSRIFVATGLFLVVAIVLGVAFGGVRVLTKRLFPGKVFDRPKDLEVLQLGLSGKRIDSDFN